MLLSRRLMPSLQELTAFEAVGRHASFTKAAEELALTQSAVSKQIRQLEDTLGVFLINRVKGRVVLTTLGAQFMISARRILRDYESATHAIIASGGSESTLKIAVLPTFASRWLIPRLPDFLAGHPSVTVNVTTEPTPFDFSEKAVDIAIHYGTHNWVQAETTYLCDETIIAVANPNYIKSMRIKKPADLERATLLQYATRPNLWQQWFSMAGVIHPHPLRGPIFDQFSMSSQAAVSGMGVALVPKFVVEKELREKQLQKVMETSLGGFGAYYAVVPLKMRHDPTVKSFVNWLVKAAQGQIENKKIAAE